MDHPADLQARDCGTPACHPGFNCELILLSVIDAGSLWARRLIDGMVEREAAVIGQLQEGVKR